MKTTNVALAGLVRRRREFLSWTQRDLAGALGSSASRICKLEAAHKTVATSLMLRALAVMNAPLKIAIDVDRDPFADISEPHRGQIAQRILRRKKAEHIAKKHGVDPGDVEHVLFNLTLTPQMRLQRSFQRAAIKHSVSK